MAELKTKPTSASVDEFIKSIEDEKRRADCVRVLGLMKDATRAEPKMWGPGIVGFGDFSYKSAGNRDNAWFVIGFSPRKQNLTLYLMSGTARYPKLMKRLGKHKTGRSCLYLKSLDDVDTNVLRELIETSVQDMKDALPSRA